MQIVCISRGTLAGGKKLAEQLASRLGYQCLSREEIVEEATRSGIAVGKLEMAVVKRRPLDERLALEKERYKAFVTATICERALAGSLVYHGRTGHLVLPGLAHVLRIRVIHDPEKRIEFVTGRLGLDRAKAQRYIEQVDEDRSRWVRTLYGIDWRDPANYDMVVNLSTMVAENAASALVPVAGLPEFQVTPAVQARLKDLLVASRCRLVLGSDARTADMDVRVDCQNGHVTVTYLPRDAAKAELVTDALKGVEGARHVVCTMATTNILWIQEKFAPEDPAIEHILEVATKWNAAVELMRLGREEQVGGGETGALAVVSRNHGGVLDDDDSSELADQSLMALRHRLIEAGRAGSVRKVRAQSAREVLDTIDRTVPYSLVVIGDVFCEKNHAARTRLANEMVGLLAEQLRIPVVHQKEIKTQYLFGTGQWVRMFVMGAVAALIFLAVFANQQQIFDFYSRQDTGSRIAFVAGLAVLVPLFAWCYGGFTRLFLRLLRFE